MPQIVWTANPDGWLDYYNRQWFDYTGMSLEQTEGWGWQPVLHPDDTEKCLKRWSQAVETGDNYEVEYRFKRHSDGEYRWHLGRGTPARDGQGRIVKWYGTCTDIEEHKRTEQALEEKQHEIRQINAELEQRVVARTAELAAANKELESFSYSVSHDLRSPLRSIDGFSQALLEDYNDKLDAQAQNYLQRVRAASQRMAQLIDDMLNLSRVSRGEMRREEIDLSRMARDIAEQLQKAQPERVVEVEIEDGIKARGDNGLLRIALDNLLGNAWKFTSKQPSSRIEFGAQAGDTGEDVFFVRDNGAGFDMAYADKLFGAFQRLHSADEFEGTGVGLATVQRIIRRHGGHIRAESEPGRGATFYFTL
jgi:PAS domain S-box-containing protein